MEKSAVKTIDVNAKEWFDKVNGNSYFSADVTINFGMPDADDAKINFGSLADEAVKIEEGL